MHGERPVKLIYADPNEGGWNPITHMVRLLAETLDAELVVVSAGLRTRAARRVAALGPIRRGRGKCLVVAAWPSLLLALLRSDYWLRGYDHIAGWIIDSFWTERIPRGVAYRGHFDEFFVTGAEDVQPWAAATGRPVHWLPWGSDVVRLGASSAYRPVDLQRVGRQPPEWDDDEITGRACDELGLTYAGRPPWHPDALAGHALLMKRLAQAKFALAFSNAVSPAPYTHPTREYLTGRWTDAVSCGAVVAGIPPQARATRELLWPEALLTLDGNDRTNGLRRIVAAVRSWDPQVARHNYLEALARLDWRWRFLELARVLELESSKLDTEIQAIRRTLAEHARPTAR